MEATVRGTSVLKRISCLGTVGLGGLVPVQQDQLLYVGYSVEGTHLRESDISRDSVSNGQGHNVSWNQVSCKHVPELAIPQAAWERRWHGDLPPPPFHAF